MSLIESNIRTSGDEFRANFDAMQALVNELVQITAATALGGSERARGKHTERGKLHARERINRLVDPSSPFLEL